MGKRPRQFQFAFKRLDRELTQADEHGKNLRKALATKGVAVHNAVVGGGLDWVEGGVIQTDAMTAALAILVSGVGASVSDATQGDGYVAIYDAGTVGTADMALFYIDHAATGTVLLAADIHFIGVLTDFGTTLTDGFVI